MPSPQQQQPQQSHPQRHTRPPPPTLHQQAFPYIYPRTPPPLQPCPCSYPPAPLPDPPNPAAAAWANTRVFMNLHAPWDPTRARRVSPIALACASPPLPTHSHVHTNPNHSVNTLVPVTSFHGPGVRPGVGPAMGPRRKARDAWDAWVYGYKAIFVGAVISSSSSSISFPSHISPVVMGAIIQTASKNLGSDI
ncbi:hypothetical protein JB92DRAFT_3108398 [Gautieria morchelliformis]|nr:hypothetical protein JB92DRAFT_3108398 [Gautieria morchelliformis]